MTDSLEPGQDTPESADRTGPRLQGRHDGWVLAGVFIAGLALRLSTIDTRGLWLDEAVSIDQASRPLSAAIMTQVGGVHPPLFHILMHYWIGAFGSGEVAVRSFALVFGMAAVLAAYWAGKELFDSSRVGLLAAGVIAFSPYHIWYAQEARMYTMVLLFGLLSVGFLGSAVRRGSPGRWTAYFAVTLLGLFSHYFFAVLVLGEALYFLVSEVFGRLSALSREGRRRTRWLRPWRVFSEVPALGMWLVAMVAMGGALSAWVTWAVILPQVTAGRGTLIASITSAGLGYGQLAPSFAVRFNDVVLVLVEMTAGFHPEPAMFGLVAMWPLVIYLTLLLLGRLEPMRRETVMLVWCTSGVVLVCAIGQWQGQVLASRYFMALAAPAGLLVARLIDRIPGRGRVAIVAIGIALALVAWTDQSFDHANMMRYDDREAIAYVARSYRPGDVIVYEPFYTDVLFAYYLPKDLVAYDFPQRGDFGAVRNAKAQIGQDLARVTASSRRVWLVLSYQNIDALRGDTYNTTQWLVRNGFGQRQHTVLNQVEVLRFDATAQSGQVATPTIGGAP